MILVDSDLLIAHLRGVAAAHDWLVTSRTAQGPLATSVVSVAEITDGMRSGERRAVWRLIDVLGAQEVDEVIARRADE